MGAGCCRADNAGYPVEIPQPEASLPPGLEILYKNNTESVQQATDLAARSFAGTETADPPAEFDWLLSDVPDRSDSSQQSERVHRMSATMAFCMHYSFVLGRRGLVLVARSGAWGSDSVVPSGAESPKIIGVTTLCFYPNKWSPSVDGMCTPMKAAMSAGASKWSKTQNQFLNSKRMGALEKPLQKLHKKYASGPHIYIWVVAVDPEAQGQGVGSKMMRAVSAIADVLKLPCYLECDSGKNEDVYRRFGYATVGKEDVTVEKGARDGTQEMFPGGMCAMRREPGPRE